MVTNVLGWQNVLQQALFLILISSHNEPTTRTTALTGSRAWQIWTQTGSAKSLYWQMTGLFYKTKQKVSQWCHDTGSLINPNKAQTVCCTLDNRAAGKVMPAATSDGAVVEWINHLRCLGINRMLANTQHAETRFTALCGKISTAVCVDDVTHIVKIQDWQTFNDFFFFLNLFAWHCG